MSITSRPATPEYRDGWEATFAPKATPPVDRTAITTLHGTPVDELREAQAKQPTGQHADYIVLTDEERRRGFVRPVRRSYRHVGTRPKHPLRDLTDEEKAMFADAGYAKFEVYPEECSPKTGRFWTPRQLASGCGAVTSMGAALAETYARDPGFYGATFCTGCNAHFAVGAEGEFVWEDAPGERVGT